MDIKMALERMLLGLFLLAAGSCSAHAGITVFTNRLDWEAAMGGNTGNITDNLDSGTQVSGVIDRGSYVISGTAQNAFPNFNSQTSIDGSGYLRVLLQGSPQNYTTFTFNLTVLALGYDINPQNFNLGASVDFTVDGTLTGSYKLPSTDVNGFVGFVSDTPFTSFEITTTNTDAWHGIDNVEAYSAPEPSVADLELAGIAGVLIVRLHRSRCATTKLPMAKG